MTTNPDDADVYEVAMAICADIKRQFDGHPIPGFPPQIDSWTATGGVLECEQLAKAAIAAYEKRRAEPRRKSPKHIDDHV